MYEEKIIPPKKSMPQAVDGTLRKFALRVPEVIYQCSGIMIFGKRIKSLVFSTDLSIIKNVNADAIIAVYPFTPQPIITQALLLAADIPVFAGVGGGLTQGQRVVNLAMFAEMQGATGVVLNAPTASAVVSHVAETIDIPVVLTVARADTDFDERIRAGANIFNVSAAAETCAASASSTPTCPSLRPAARRMRASSRPSKQAPTPSRGRRRPTARSSATSWLPTARTNRTPDPVHRKTDPNACSGRFFTLIAAAVRPRGRTAAHPARCEMRPCRPRRPSGAFPSPSRRGTAARSAGARNTPRC